MVDKKKDKRELQLSEEAQRARARGIPQMPPLADRQQHRLLHLPYRSWCRHYVNGHGREDANKRVRSHERLVPRVWLDYTFVNMGKEVLTILCLRDESRGAGEGPRRLCGEGCEHSY